MARARASIAASATLIEPNTLVLTPSAQSCSSSGTCLSAAAWNTRSGRKFLSSWKMRSRSRMSARRPSMIAVEPLVASASSTACSAGSEFSMTSRRSAPNVIDAVADFRPDRAASAGDRNRRGLERIFPGGGNRSARLAAAGDPRPRSGPAAAPANAGRRHSSSDGRRLAGSPSRRARIRMVSGLASGASAVGVRTSLATCCPRIASALTVRSRSSTVPSTGTFRITVPWSALDGDRMPTGRIRWTAPLSMPRSRTSASAARPSTSVGVASKAIASRRVRVSRK